MKKKVIIISSENDLKDYFNDDSLRMKKNSCLSFHDSLQLGSNILFEGKINFGKNNKIENNSSIKDMKLGDNNIIKPSSITQNSIISNNVIIGPFAFVRENTFINKNCIIGAYVEVTRSKIGKNTYASHRAFIGDSNIDENVIIGAGVVFCNFSFKTNKKEKITIGRNCKIGSNTVLIAPTNIRKDTIISALAKYK
jgi:bifunctional UDP-N-acetylglucosamine pyrophosphorylase / glucosamine-1-phosphate N-acetyltransferase